MHDRTGFVFNTISCEGTLFSPDFLRQIVDRDPLLVGLTPETYHLTEEKLNEAINRSWMKLLLKWRAFHRSHQLDNNGAFREYWVFPLFVELGYGRLVAAKPLEIEGKKYTISHGWGRLPIHIVNEQKELDDRIYNARGGNIRQSPHMLVQELLNRSHEHPWGIVTNGLRLRLLRHDKRLVHRTYLEFDLEAMIQGEVYVDFVLLWLLCHQSRFENLQTENCWLERWLHLAHEQSIRALEHMRIGVEEAVRVLGQGFLSCRINHELCKKLRTAELNAENYFRQILRLIYRLLVLFVAEDRELLLIPTASEEAKKRYINYYSTARLRKLALNYRGTQHTDLFCWMRFVMKKLAKDPGCPELALPPLDGFLFEQSAIEDLEECDLTNACLLDAVRALAFLEQDGMLKPVDFQLLGAEELGSVYEGILEFHTVIDGDPPGFHLQVKPAHLHKTTGSYYTPPDLVKSLLDSALEPVLVEASRQPDPRKALLNIKVCDPACGSGHFLIAAARRIAYQLAFMCAGNVEPDRETWCAAMRDVVRRCIYGVDNNAMAVELCKVSLSIEAIEPGKPLIFLDHHILYGNSLLGATPALLRRGVPDSAFTPGKGDVPKLSSIYGQRNQEGLAGQWHLLLEPMDTIVNQLEDMQILDDSSYEHIQKIKQCHHELTTKQVYKDNLLLSHAWCAAFFWRKAYIASESRAFPITQGIIRELLENHRIYQDMREDIECLAEDYQFFHWHLMFPDVFTMPVKDDMPENKKTGWHGGFDVVLGNPPFIFGEHRDQRMKAFLQSVFQLARGQYDTYWLFIELGLYLAHSRGRLAFIVPDTLLARDETQKTREMLLKDGIETIVHCGTTFKAHVSTIFFVVSKGSTSQEIKVSHKDSASANSTYSSKERFLSDPQHRFLIHISDNEAQILSRIQRECQSLHAVAKISRGEEIGKKDVFSQGPIPILVGEDVSRYFIKLPSRFLHTVKKNIARYQAPKIVLMKTGDRCIAGLDTVGYVTMQSVYSLHLTCSQIAHETLLALLNSRFVHYFIYKTFTSYKGIFPQLNQSTIQAIPIPFDFSDYQEELITLVRNIQQTKESLQLNKSRQQGSTLEPSIKTLEGKIDQIIYHLYKLTDEEITIIERDAL